MVKIKEVDIMYVLGEKKNRQVASFYQPLNYPHSPHELTHFRPNWFSNLMAVELLIRLVNCDPITFFIQWLV